MNPQIIARSRGVAKLLSLSGKLPIFQSFFRRCFRHANGIIRVHDFDGDLTIDLSLSEHMQRRIFWMDYYNREIIKLLNNILKPGMTLIDVGANIGEITLIAAKRVGETGKVIAFEPMDRIADTLEKNSRINDLNQVAIVRMGLADSIATVPLYTDIAQGKEGDEHHGLGSIFCVSRERLPLQTIQITTLDDYIDENPVSRIDLIKIDIEGAELPCLQGAVRTLQNFRPSIIIEVQEYSSSIAGYPASDILEFLATLGYEFHTIGRKGRLTALEIKQLGAYQNVFCVPRDHSPAITPTAK